MNKKNIITTSIIAIIILVGLTYSLRGTETIREIVKSNVGAVSSPDVYSYMNVHGKFEQGGGLTTVTPITSTYTLTFANMANSNIITFTASSSQEALTVTLPATTTMPLGASVGSYRTWVIENPFTGAATTTTIAAGTGIDLQEPDGQDVVIGINNYGFLTCFREASTDIVCRVDETIPGD